MVTVDKDFGGKAQIIIISLKFLVGPTQRATIANFRRRSSRPRWLMSKPRMEKKVAIVAQDLGGKRT